MSVCLLAACGTPKPTPQQLSESRSRLAKRWLFVWRDMADPKEVDRMIARFPEAAAAGYNGVAFPYDVAREKGPALKAAATTSGLDLVAVVMSRIHDNNDAEGVLAKDAVYRVHDGLATLEPDRPAIANSGFELAEGNRLDGWSLQDEPGVTSFVDRQVFHGGRASLRLENLDRFPHARVMQSIRLTPRRQYRISFWLRTENLAPVKAEVKVLSDVGRVPISFQTFNAAATQDWTRYDIVFNSLEHPRVSLYLGAWAGRAGRMWWDDVEVEEIGLVNVLRRPGTPVTVRSESGQPYDEGKDFERIVDPALNPWRAFHPSLAITLLPHTRMKNGEQLRVSYYHPLVMFADRISGCLSEERIFDDWRAEVAHANDVYRPRAFLMAHDEIRVANQCALCQSQHKTPGELLASNVRRAAAIVREARPDAEIWVWSDMFDPMGNAVDQYFAANGSFKGSWEGLDKDVGIVNWQGMMFKGNARFFADRGLRQILAGYYDQDETGAGMAAWLDDTATTPGIVGAMYTTWDDKYSAMSAWARSAWGGSAARH